MDLRESQVQQDLKALQEYRDLLVVKARRESQAQQDPEAFRAHQEYLDRQVRLVRQALGADVGLMGVQVPKALRDYLDH